MSAAAAGHLRRFTEADVHRLLTIMGDEGHRMLQPSTSAAVRAWLTSSYDLFALVDRDSELLGSVHLKVDQECEWAELGFVIARGAEGRGYATAGVRMVLQYGFEVLGLSRLRARSMARNRAAVRVLQKNGFVPELIEASEDGLSDPMLSFLLLRESWSRASGALS